MSKPGSMRDQMPVITPFIDACREYFGLESINASIRGGLAGQPTFYASENGLTIGTKCPDAVFSVSGDALTESLMRSESKCK